jgi:hypothetical protein
MNEKGADSWRGNVGVRNGTTATDVIYMYVISSCLSVSDLSQKLNPELGKGHPSSPSSKTGPVVKLRQHEGWKGA